MNWPPPSPADSSRHGEFVRASGLVALVVTFLFLSTICADIANAADGSFTVSVKAHKYAKFGASGMLVNKIRVSGPAVRSGKPVIRCNPKYCGKPPTRTRKRFKRTRHRQSVTFSNVNWLIAKGHGLTVFVLPRSRRSPITYAVITPPDAQNKSFTVLSVGCANRSLKKKPCPSGTNLPLITHVAKRCETPKFVSPPIVDSPPQSPAEAGWNNTFVRVSGTTEIYRMAGGAPIWVQSWSAFGGEQPVTMISQSQFDAFRQVPADGTFIKGPIDPTVYITVGGAPIPLSSWNVYGGSKPVVVVDQAAIDLAQMGSNSLEREILSHLRRVPADGSFIKGHGDATIYRMAGGAPIPFPSWSIYGGARPTTLVDQVALNKAGGSGPWQHIRVTPADGTLLNAAGSNVVYRTVGGKPVRVCEAFDPSAVVLIAPEALNLAGTGGVWNHLVGPFEP